MITRQHINILLLTDVYKLGHMEQYPEGTTKIYSYLCARSNKKYNEMVFFGLQYYSDHYLTQKITYADVEEFIEYFTSILGKPPSQRIVNRLFALADLGYLPLEIKAVPEGSVVPVKNALVTVTNTLPEFHWVVGFFESLLLKVWNTCSVATLSHKFKRLVTKFAHTTSDSLDLIPFQVHDFGYRGCSSEETAAISGASHLINFFGTDTIPAIKMLKDHYGATGLIGASVPASEHSVMCAFGPDHELEAFRNMLHLYPDGIVSIVSDTYNLWRVLTEFAPILKDEILARNGKVVFRPDSGDPEKIICGDPHAPIGSPEYKGSLKLLEEVFGSSVNSKGFKELNPKVGLIYGDGMYFERFERILTHMQEQGWASTNLVIGIGGLLLQQHNRDDGGFAFKATFAVINEKEVELFKDPITDPGKRSHKGRMMLDKTFGYVTYDQVSEEEETMGELKTVFKDGKITKFWTLDEIRERVKV